MPKRQRSYEKLGAFYLGRVFDTAAGAPTSEQVLYDAKDLTTHGVCVGMTGSGKTGLCISLLEEAAIDSIPVLAIDPKGDLGNMLLTFPQLRPTDFAPWVDPGEATRKGMDVAGYAAKTADLWRNGLAQWDQDGARIRRLRAAAEFAIYTPGSTAGRPLTVLRSFAAPPPALRDDSEALGERVQSAVSGLLAMLGIDADPIRSREHILLSHLFRDAWREGRDLGLGDVIRGIQTPPFDKVGFFDLESFFPSADRFGFAMAVNNLLASPSFAPWTEGEPLEIPRLLWTPEGKPRVAVLSIAHLSEAQRMFFVTLLLNELVAWMRTQSGTTSLRALLYMDEVFGYLPPTANPPSKLPMLTLLKQARAFGVGCLLATQNPVDLDYKALSNAGTWFLGRLQTERDKARVLDGLEGASATAGVAFDRQKLEATLSGLKSRVFLMNNVHEDAPVLFHVRWAMSYLRGPLTREHIRSLTKAAPAKGRAAPAAGGGTRARRRAKQRARDDGAAAGERPLLPPGIEDGVLPIRSAVPAAQRLCYQPALLGTARLHFVAARNGIDEWREVALLASPGDDDDPWDEASPLEGGAPALDGEPDGRGAFDEVPGAATKKKSYTGWKRALKGYLYRAEALPIWRCKELKATSEAGESERDFRARLTLLAREKRDLAIEKLRRRFAPKLSRLQERIRTAEDRVEREREQYKQKKLDTVVSVGTTLLGALFGRKVASVGTVGRAATTARRASRAAKERGDIGRAEEKVDRLEEQLRDLEAEFADRSTELREGADPANLELDRRDLRPRKSDIDADVTLVWAPWADTPDGRRALF
ncbi:MAG: DUF87 domain-containing protein [Planctomycetota bacterium]